MRALVKVDTVEVCGDGMRGALHARFVGRRQRRGALDVEEARDLIAALRTRVWEYAGCATFVEYLERYGGYGAKAAHERVSVASALQDLPLVEAELEAGELTYSHVRELVRIVVRDTEQAWVDHTRGMTVKQTVTELRGHARGDLPTDETTADEMRRTLSLRHVRPSTLARLYALASAIEDERGDKFVDDEDLLSSVCDALETGGVRGDAPSVAESPPVWLTPEGDVHAHGHELSDDEREYVLCCGHLAGQVDDPSVRKRKQFSDKQRARILARDGHKCSVPGCRSRRHLEIHHRKAVENGGTNEDANLITLCSGHHRLLHRGKLRILPGVPELLFERETPGERRRKTICRASSPPAWAC